MEAISVHQAKENLSRLLSRVELGEEIVIASKGAPVAKLVPFKAAVADRRACRGRDRGLYTIPDDFDAPLPEDILAAFEGDTQ